MIMRTELLLTGYPKLILFLASLLLALGSNASYAADPGKGGGFYAKNCATCHGASGTSVMPGAPSFARGEGLMQPDTQLLNSIKAGKNAMPAYRGILSDIDILDVIAYLRTLH
jgi:cytochrome c6